MFFLLSKLLAFVITPIVWIITFLLLAYFKKDELKRKKFFRWALILILFFSNGFLLDEAFRCWELPATPFHKMKQYDYGILLGGMSANDETLDRVQFFRGVDRLIQTIDLYKRGVIKKIIFTGGSGRVLHPEMKEGELIKPYILKMGVAEADLIIENESNNTRENALFTKAIIDKEKLQGDFLLITSAFHMRRSIGCFTKVGIQSDYYVTDRYAGPRKWELDFLLIPNSSTLSDWSVLFKEWVGYITYKLVGYI
jgi:uncharacterized SAM-binding protein YcdF (DUF218 family)